jgi:hypothetical protein
MQFLFYFIDCLEEEISHRVSNSLITLYEVVREVPSVRSKDLVVGLNHLISLDVYNKRLHPLYMRGAYPYLI